MKVRSTGERAGSMPGRKTLAAKQASGLGSQAPITLSPTKDDNAKPTGSPRSRRHGGPDDVRQPHAHR